MHLVDVLAGPLLQQDGAVEGLFVVHIVGGKTLADLLGGHELFGALLLGELGGGAHLAGGGVDGVAAVHAVLLHEQNFQTGLRRLDGGEHAGDTGADDEDVHFPAEVYGAVADGAGFLTAFFGVGGGGAQAAGNCHNGTGYAQGTELSAGDFLTHCIPPLFF